MDIKIGSSLRCASLVRVSTNFNLAPMIQTDTCEADSFISQLTGNTAERIWLYPAEEKFTT